MRAGDRWVPGRKTVVRLGPRPRSFIHLNSCIVVEETLELGERSLRNVVSECPLIAGLLKLRRKQAQLLGYHNFAEVSLVPKMAESPREVLQFLRDLAQRAAALCLDLKANDVVVLDVRGVTDMTDYFVIASGTSDTHVRSIAEHVLEELRKEGTRAHHVEGLQQGNRLHPLQETFAEGAELRRRAAEADCA